jgi:hypothetical protein
MRGSTVLSLPFQLAFPAKTGDASPDTILSRSDESPYRNTIGGLDVEDEVLTFKSSNFASLKRMDRTDKLVECLTKAGFSRLA